MYSMQRSAAETKMGAGIVNGGGARGCKSRLPPGEDAHSRKYNSVHGEGFGYKARRASHFAMGLTQGRGEVEMCCAACAACDHSGTSPTKKNQRHKEIKF